jgi:hypothetical protein
MSRVAVAVAVAVAAIILILLLLRRQRQRQQREGFSATAVSAITPTVKDTRALLIENYGEGILWVKEYTDLYSIQETYLTTVQNVDKTIDPRAELERGAGVAGLTCTPVAVEKVLSRSPGTVADIREYLQCLPPTQDLEKLAAFLVNEIKVRVAEADRALSGDVGLIGAGDSGATGEEGFAIAPASCDIAQLCAAQAQAQAKPPAEWRATLVVPRSLSPDQRAALQDVITQGLAAKRRADEMNSAAQAGTLTATPPADF